MNSVSNGMTNEQIKEEILTRLGRIERLGMQELIAYLNASDFFTAPASTRFRDAVEGGLARRAYNTWARLESLNVVEVNIYGNPPINTDSLTIVGLLCELGKTGFYKAEVRNVKTDEGWVPQTVYFVDDRCPFGGMGEKSVYMLSSFIRLTRDEAMAIRWSDGGFDPAVKGGNTAIYDAFTTHPLATMLCAAKLLATYSDGQLA